MAETKWYVEIFESLEVFTCGAMTKLIGMINDGISA